MRKYFKKYLPTHESVRNHRLLGRFGHFLQHPNLWNLNRDSVASGVAIGLFCGLIPGPLQMLGALLAAVLWRGNLPVALLATFYTNPLTIVPLYFVAVYIGSLLTGTRADMHAPPETDWSHFGLWLHQLFDWGTSLGKPLLIGLPTLGLLLAIVGYFSVQWGWKLWVRWEWVQRKKRRAQPKID